MARGGGARRSEGRAFARITTFSLNVRGGTGSIKSSASPVAVPRTALAEGALQTILQGLTRAGSGVGFKASELSRNNAPLAQLAEQATLNR